MTKKFLQEQIYQIKKTQRELISDNIIFSEEIKSLKNKFNFERRILDKNDTLDRALIIIYKIMDYLNVKLESKFEDRKDVVIEIPKVEVFKIVKNK